MFSTIQFGANLDRVTTAIAEMDSALAAGFTFKASFDSIKERIERPVDRAWKAVVDLMLAVDREDWNDALNAVYYGGAPTAHTIATVQKRVNKLISSDHEAVATAADAFLAEIAPIYARLTTLKGMIKKRQTKAETTAAAKAAYRAPATEIAITNTLRTLLTNHADDARLELVESIVSYTNRMITVYLNAAPVRGTHPSVSAFFRRDAESADIVGRCVEFHAASMTTPVRKATADVTIANYALRTATEILAAFIEKNLVKLTSVVSRKGDFADAEVLRGIRRGGMTGTIKVTFADGSHFTVDNNIVFVENTYGTRFNRFPTTFHNVYLRGTKMKNASEKKMNEVFAVAA
jgi:hypothetical protein